MRKPPPKAAKGSEPKPTRPTWLKVDAAASMRQWVIDFRLGKHILTLPAVSAADWLLALDSGTVQDILEMCTNQDTVTDVLIDEGLSSDEIGTGIEALVEQASGRAFYTTLVLVKTALGAWDVIGGDIVLAGIDLNQVSFSAALDAIYTLLVRATPPEKLNDFHAALRPPLSKAEMVAEMEISMGPRPAGGHTLTSGGRYAGERPKTRPRTTQPPRGEQSSEPIPRPS
jgi:hypothetical protein